MSVSCVKSKLDISSDFPDYDARVYLDRMVADYANHGLSRGIAIEEVAKLCGMSTSRLRSALFNGSYRLTIRDYLDIRHIYLEHLASEKSRALARVDLLEAERVCILRGIYPCFIVSFSATLSSVFWHQAAVWAGKLVTLLCAGV